MKLNLSGGQGDLAVNTTQISLVEISTKGDLVESTTAADLSVKLDQIDQVAER